MRVFEPSGQFGDSKGRIGKMRKSSDKGIAGHVSRDSVNTASFLEELDNAAEEQLKKSLDELIGELAGQAEVLERRRTFEELEKYKKMVKNFMDKAVRMIFTVKVSDSSKIMIKRKKVYMLVEMVDAELEKLTKQVLEKQSAGLDLLATLEKIKGILIDMYS
jgi:uncharacterized protein